MINNVILAFLLVIVGNVYGQNLDLPGVTKKPATGIVFNADMNVLYQDYDNHIQVSTLPCVAEFSNISAICSGCSLSKKENGNYIASVNTGKTATIVVTGIAAEGQKVEIARQEFRIKRLPTPTPTIVGVGVEASTVEIGKIKQASRLSLDLKGYPFNALAQGWTIIKFTVSTVKNGQVAEAKCKGSRLSSVAQNYLKGLKKGQKLYIEDIWAQGPKGQIKLPSLILKVL
jgi:hypothetical protein